MSDNNLNDLDILLKNRHVPEPASNLAHRIIAARDHKTKRSHWDVLSKKLSAVFLMPRPAMAFACFVLLGLAIILPQLQSMSPQTDDYIVQEYFASVMDYDFIYEAFDISSI